MVAKRFYYFLFTLILKVRFNLKKKVIVFNSHLGEVEREREYYTSGDIVF